MPPKNQQDLDALKQTVCQELSERREGEATQGSLENVPDLCGARNKLPN
jgi:hypothetical protein